MKRELAVDIDGCRDRIASLVDEMTAIRGSLFDKVMVTGRDDPRVAMLRMVAAHILLNQDKLSLDEIAQVLGETESWVCNSTHYVERRIGNYYAFKLYVDRMIETYARVCSTEAGKASRAGVNAIQRRIAGLVGMTVTELLEFQRDNDMEIVQKVAAYLLFSHDELVGSEVAEVMLKDERWAVAAKDYVEHRLRRGDQGLKDFVTKTTEAYELAEEFA